MSSDEDFLRRWSRRKRQAAAAKPAVAAPQASVELPSLDSLTFESDFSAFLRANIEESVKRAALKKLFRDPRFNVMDGLDTYIDDYTKMDPIPEEMMRTLEHARSTLFPPQHEPEQAPGAQREAPAAQAQSERKEDDGDPRQDA